MIDFKKGDGLVPVIVQDSATAKVLMLGYMNEEAYTKTNQEKTMKSLSKLICITFHRPPNDNEIVKFKNGNKQDCRAENLEWIEKIQPRNIRSAFFSVSNCI